MPSLLLNWKNIIVGMFLGLVIGAVGGWHFAGQSQEAGQAQQQQAARKTDAVNERQVAQDSASLDKQQTAKAAQITSIKSEIAKYATPQKPRTQVPSDPDVAPAGTGLRVGGGVGLVAKPVAGDQGFASDLSRDSGLSVALVRLLNAARSRTADPGIAQSNDDEQTPAGLAIGDLVQNDIDIIGLYWELAEAHDLLVAQVLKLQSDQRKRLGLPE